jgi:hypothetical protein
MRQWMFFTALNKLVPMHAQPEIEIEGLDLPETGVPGYSGFQLASDEARLRLHW